MICKVKIWVSIFIINRISRLKSKNVDTVVLIDQYHGGNVQSWYKWVTKMGISSYVASKNLYLDLEGTLVVLAL